MHPSHKQLVYGDRGDSALINEKEKFLTTVAAGLQVALEALFQTAAV